MHDELKTEIETLYQQHFTEKMAELNALSIADDNEQKAQKFSIKQTALELFLKYADLDKNLIWAQIYRAHVARRSGIDIQPETIAKVISADQSWKKSSGHAFEEMVKDLCSQILAPSGIRMLLQRDVSYMLAQSQLMNEGPDMEFLRSNIGSSVFDLFLEKDGFIFGCVQAKTSIRDRVTRDREPSLAAMDHYFWSTMFVLDGDFFRLPKFKNMVKGDSSEFTHNGWHGVYVFSLPKSVECERIYRLDPELSLFRQHTEMAYNSWMNQRQWFNISWMPEQPN